MHKQIDTAAEIARATEVWEMAEKAAHASIEVGKPFVGAFGVADSLGFARDSRDWDVAVSAAVAVIGSYTIYTDAGLVYSAHRPF